MEILLIILGSLLIVAGFIGSFLPVVPGPPLSYVGLLALQLTASHPFSWQFFLVWGLIVGALMILDNVIPAYGAKTFGGSAYGIWGCIVGMGVGLFFSPVGLVVGPLAGAFIGELIGGKDSDQAFRSALGSFAGFLASTVLKVVASGLMGYYFFINIYLQRVMNMGHFGILFKGFKNIFRKSFNGYGFYFQFIFSRIQLSHIQYLIN